jgi:transposase
VRQQALEEVPMTMVGAFDIHRRQLTYELVDVDSGEVQRGRVESPTRHSLRAWLADRPVLPSAVAFEGCTGWRFVAEELTAAGVEAWMGDPAELAGRRGPKRRAKTDRSDAHLLVTQLLGDHYPRAWVPPPEMLEARTLGRAHLTLADERRAWRQRLHALFFHHGLPEPPDLRTRAGRDWIAELALPPGSAQLLDTGVAIIDALEVQLHTVDGALSEYQRWPGPAALRPEYGIGPLLSVVIWAELGDCRRFSSSDDSVRYAGIDVTVYNSDRHRAPGHLSRQGPAVLRWALFEAALHAHAPASPDHAYYLDAKARLGHKRATIAVARKLLRRCHHRLRALGDDVLTAG